MIDDATFAAIIADIAKHGRARLAVREHEINDREFWGAIAADEERAKQYARAKQLGMAAIAEEILEIADRCRTGKVITDGPKGREVKTGDMVERARLQVESRKWLLARLVPKIYGDRTIIAGDADNPLATIDLTDAKSELARRLGEDDADSPAPGMDQGTIQ